MRITFEPETDEEKQAYPKAPVFEGVFEFGFVGFRTTLTGPEPIQQIRYGPANPMPLIEKVYGLSRYLEWWAMGVAPPPLPSKLTEVQSTDGN